MKQQEQDAGAGCRRWMQDAGAGCRSRLQEQDAGAGRLLSWSAPLITFFCLCGGKDGAAPSAQLIGFRLQFLLPSSPHEPRRREEPHSRALGLGGAICPCSLQP